MQTVAIYARVSTDKQAEQGYSLETQIAACRKKADDLGAGLVQEFVDDGYSGAYLERPALEQLRDALDAKTYNIVICYTPDRLARRLSHQLLLTEEIERSGAALCFVSDEYKTTPEGRMMYQMQGVFAEYEREKIKERTMRGKRGKLRSGHPVLNHRILGYDWDKAESQYIINNAEAAVVRRIFDLYLSGDVGGIEQIARLLTSEKVTTKQGGFAWHGSSVHKILIRQMYTGKYYANRIYTTKTGAHKLSQTIRPESDWILMSCPAIITQEIFDAVQAKLKQNFSCRHKTGDNITLLQGVLKCGICGRSMVQVVNAKNNYYACSGRYQYNRPVKVNPPCPAMYCRIPDTDSAFWSLLENICKSPKKLAATIAQTHRNAPKTAENRRADIMNRIEKIKADKAAVMEWYTAGYISRDDATTKLAELKKEEENAKARLDNVGDAPLIPNDAKLQSICNAVTNCPNKKNARRKVVQAIIKYITVQRTSTGKKSHDLKFIIYFL